MSAAVRRRLPLSAVAKSCVGLANYGKELIRGVLFVERAFGRPRGTLSEEANLPTVVSMTPIASRVCACAVAVLKCPGHPA